MKLPILQKYSILSVNISSMRYTTSEKGSKFIEKNFKIFKKYSSNIALKAHNISFHAASAAHIKDAS